jgi:CheY-like chemotaxis protein
MSESSMAASRERRIVLVVEDDHDMRVTLRALLESDGYEVITAAQGHAALSEIDRRRLVPDLILADLRMPLMDGWAFVAAVRARSDLDCVPIGVHTSEEDRMPPDMVNFVVRKPAAAGALLQLVREHLGCVSGRRAGG